jgi:integrase
MRPRPEGYRLVRYRGRFYVEFYDGADRKRSSTGTADAATAKAYLDRFVHARQRQAEPSRVSVGAIMEAYLADRRQTVAAPAFLDFSWKALKPHFAGMLPEHIVEPTCKAYQKARLGDGVKLGTIRGELGVLRTGLLWGERKNMLAKAPYIWRPGSQPARERFLTREESQRLLAAIKQHHLRLFVLLGLHTAARAGALLELTWDRVDLDRRRIRLATGHEKARQKGRATVPINNTLLAALTEAKAGATTNYVVEYAGGKVRSVGVGIARAAKRAGLGPLGPHVLRHTAAVRMAEAGIPLEKIAEYLGHSDTRVTRKHYAQYLPEFLADAALALE